MYKYYYVNYGAMNLHRITSRVPCNRRFHVLPSDLSEVKCSTTGRVQFCTEAVDNELMLSAKEINQEHYLLPSEGHEIYVIQPDIKWISARHRVTTAELQLSEACALVESLPRWRVGGRDIYSLKHMDKKAVFSKGNLSEIARKVTSSASASAVFINIESLTSLQLASLQAVFRVPVYDRYTIVLQIFRTRARTKEAKLQVSLAEIPYLRSRLRGMHDGSLDQQKGGLSTIGGSGETYLEIRKRLLKEKETKIKAELEVLKSKRQVLRQERSKREIPIIAVIGYTNAGKTSLIKALSGEEGLVPRDQLFATLDVTAHAGRLPNNTKVIYMDTVGFISDIPTSLVESFAATLEDIRLADGIIYVQDASHPDQRAQNVTVKKTLEELILPDSLRDNVIEIRNKADLIEVPTEHDGHIYISTTTGQGLQELIHKVQDLCLGTAGRVKKVLKVPMRGNLLAWLYKEAAVVKVDPMPHEPEYLLVETIMTAKTLANFKKTFRKRR